MRPQKNEEEEEEEEKGLLPGHSGDLHGHEMPSPVITKLSR